MVSSECSVAAASGCPCRAKKKTRCSATGSIASRCGWRSALVVSAIANSSLPASTAFDSSSKSPTTAWTRSRELAVAIRPSAMPSGSSAANMSVPNTISGACRPASSSRSRVRSRAWEKIRLAWSSTSRPASPGFSALAAVSTSLDPSALSNEPTRFNSDSGVRPSAFAARVRSRDGRSRTMSSTLGVFTMPSES